DANLTYAQYRDLRHAGVFQDLAFDAGLRDTVWRNAGRGEVAWFMATSPNFFDVLGIRAAAGRFYTQRDEGQPVAVVSHGFWRRRLGADPGALGRSLEIGGRLYTIAGVLPGDYRSILGHGVAPEIYMPAPPDSSARCHPFGRLRDSLSRVQTRQALAAAVPSLGIPEFARELPAIRAFSGLDSHFAAEGDARRWFLFFAALFGAAAVLALIACSNVAGLLLARRMSRHRELAIRQALGANRWQLTRPLLAEAMALVAAGAAAGLALDAILRARLSVLRWPSAYNLPMEFHFQTDRGLLLYALLAAAAALAVCSLAGAGDRSLALAMKPDARRWSPRHALVAVQVVFSMALLMLGALFTRSFLYVAREGAGFDTDRTLIAAVHPAARGDHGWAWRERLIETIRRVPGVEAATSTDWLPLMGEAPETPLRRVGEPPPAARNVYALAEGEDYFATLRIPILRGRDFAIEDRDRKPAPAIVNRTLARQLFGDADPIGARLVRGREKEDVLEIVGLAADSRIRTIGESAAPAVYTPNFNGQFLVRVAGDPAQWIEPLGRALADRDAALDIHPLRDALAGALFPMRMAAAFVGALGGLGLVLSLVGVYGAVSYAVGRRTREMGIRAALGATPARIVWTAGREAAVLLAVGAAIGMIFAVSAIRPLADLLPDGLNPWDPRLFGAAVVLLLGTGAAAASIPARRASRIDPVEALREE
ncbi:MAG TPA: ABC transporter permease, partial [Candidatus Sulfopaludibacter sp.]|nr:ABC transporter permease [Candidatus Sulfopaludibacter sp.]